MSLVVETPNARIARLTVHSKSAAARTTEIIGSDDRKLRIVF